MFSLHILYVLPENTLQAKLGIEQVIKKNVKSECCDLSRELHNRKLLIPIQKLKQICKTCCPQHINISDGKPLHQKILIQLKARISYQIVLLSPQLLALLILYNEFS